MSPSRKETRIIHDYSKTAHPLSQLTKDASNYASRATQNHSHRFYLVIATRRTKPRHSRQRTPHRHPNPFDERTDHTDLMYFHMKHKLSQRQACWAPSFSQFKITINKTDALSRRTDLKEGIQNSETEKIACSWIKISSLYKHYNRHIGKRHTSVQENEVETLPCNSPRPVIKELEDQKLEDDIVLYHRHVYVPKGPDL